MSILPFHQTGTQLVEQKDQVGLSLDGHQLLKERETKGISF